MKRLTTDNPSGNFETMLNFVYGKDGWAHIRSDGEETDVLLSKWAAEQCISRDECEDIFRDGVLPEEIDTTICDCMMDFPDCPIALAYCFASQAVHMRNRLKMYEDILFAEDGTELASLDDLRELVKARDNPPLTLDWRGSYCPVCDSEYPGGCDTCFYSSRREELEPCKSCAKAFQDSEGEECPGYKPANYCFNCGRPITEYAKLAYRRKPEEGTK